MTISRYDYFAGQALAGLLANSEAGGEPTLHALFGSAKQRHADGLADAAHMLAASMVAVQVDMSTERALRNLVAALGFNKRHTNEATREQVAVYYQQAIDHLAKLEAAR